MISISKLYCGTVEPADVLRYQNKSTHLPSHLLQFSDDKKPVVVYNVTKQCNLHCRHCYSNSDIYSQSEEMSTQEALQFIDSAGDFGVPVILFSGGEPLLRNDLFELIGHAKKRNMRAVLSTNGTLIKQDICSRLHSLGLSYVGISIDGLSSKHDSFRGVSGSFESAIQGIRLCKKQGLKVGLRMTITQSNIQDVPDIFKLLEQEQIPRICFYHLVSTGRATGMAEQDLSHTQTREILNVLIDTTAKLHRDKKPIEVLTVDNHADGVYLYLRMKQERSSRADTVLELLRMNGGNNSGIGIGCVSWDGTVYPDQFMRDHCLGSVRGNSFQSVWTNPDNQLLQKLRNRKSLLQGRCGRCVWQSICNGNLRARANAYFHDIWKEDPACYLTEKEISDQFHS